MKTRFMLTFFAAILGGILFLNNSTGPFANGNGNRSNSPGSNGNCSNCHSGGTFAPVTTIDVKNSQGTSVSTVEGDSVYTISVNINATSGTPSAYGFQTVIFDDSTNQSTGTLLNAPTGVQYHTGTPVKIAEHSTPSATNTFTFTWRAPASLPVGNSITVYAYGNAVNLSGGTSGDAAAGDTYALTLNPAAVGVKQTELAAEVGLNLFPNPVVNTLNMSLDSKEDAQYNISVVAMNGQTLRQSTLQVNAGYNNTQIEVADLPTGTYQLMIRDEQGRVSSRSFVKF